MPRSHYDVLGSPATASPVQLRKAYLRRARQLHPDQFGDRPPAERAKAERAMQELNAAWAVLSDADARRAYDVSLLDKRPSMGTDPVVSARAKEWQPFDATSAPVPPRAPKGPVVADQRDMEIRGTARLLRPLPLLILFGSMTALIVLAALVGGDDDAQSPASPARTDVPAGTPLGCIDINPVAVEVPCGAHDALVWDVIPAGETCADEYEAIYRQSLGGLYCITRSN